MKAATKSCLTICLGLIGFFSPLSGQEISKSTGLGVMSGLEAEDPHRLGVHLILGPGWDHEVMRMAVEEEFALADIEWTDLEDPRKGEVLYIYGGELEQTLEDSIWTAFTIRDSRIELWRPVRYLGAGGAEYVAPGMTFRMNGSAGGSYRAGMNDRTIACRQLILALRTFLAEFLKANRTSYEPPQDEPRGCASTK
ncbi:MAG TPA: hypothetical protein VJP59_09750 [Gemmatimonadota bacterium]|nr:hypothetical protein [Gemmatimonadota bacterium]